MAEGEGGGRGAGNDLLFVIMILVVLFIVWLGSGGIERARNDPGYFLKPPAPLGSDQVYGTSLTQGFAQTSGAISNSFSVTSEQLQSANRELGSNVSFGKVSPYHGLVHLAYVSGAGGSNPAQEYVEITYDGDGTQNVPLSGWRIVSGVTNSGATIGVGSRVPNSGALSFTEPIYLRPGEIAYLISGRSPIGVSFLTNKCAGYLEQFQSFSPPISNYCPYPYDELAYAQDQSIRSDNACYDFVSSLPACQLYLGRPDQSLSGSCRDFVQNEISYNGCVQNHRSDANFFGTDWRVYLNRDQSLWRDRRDVLQLLDQNNLTVDVLTY